jgi:hypothetical protein
MTNVRVADGVLYLRVSGRFPVLLSRHFMEELRFRLAPDVWATLYADDTEVGISNSGIPMIGVDSERSVPDSWIDLLDAVDSGAIVSKYLPAEGGGFLLDAYPAEMQSFLLAETASLMRHLQSAFGIVRWRYFDDIGEGAEFEPWAPMWSTDGVGWHALRLSRSLKASLGPQLRLQESVGEALEALVDQGAREPLGREIWHVATTAEPRTAVILAVTAVEVELKRLIGDCVPHSDWLVTNLPTPPIVRIIEEYLPKIIEMSPETAPPRWLTRNLRTAVSRRNSFTHGGAESSDRWSSPGLLPEEVAKHLTAASDLLWLFDLYRGHAWVTDYLSEETKAALAATRGSSISEGPPKAGT